VLSNVRSRSILIQCALLTSIAGFAYLLVSTTFANLQARGIPIGFDFLSMPSRIVISEAILSYKTRDPYYWAIVVGFANTVFISALVIVFSSVLGLIVGVTRLSSNPLAVGTCRVWVEIARNSPPIVLMIFLYSLWWKVLPPVGAALNPLPGFYVSMRGFVVPAVSLDITGAGLALFLGALLLVALGFLARRGERRSRFLVPAVLVTSVLALWLAEPKLSVDWPSFAGSNFRGGMELTPELSTILIGLTIYTTGFIAEIVRGGVNAVPIGQWEAARALGFSEALALRLVILPQMLRVVVPPMNSQYINVVKNSTLALAVGYTDFLTIMGTVINKTSHAVEGTVMIVLVYLAINLSLSAALNAYNHRVAAKER